MSKTQELQEQQRFSVVSKPITRVGKAINEYFENALDYLLAKDLVVVTDNQVSLKA